MADFFFRHGKPRMHQQELMQDAYDSISRERILLANAGTGTGKTDAVLSAAITYAHQSDLTVFFLTPKISQHRIAVDVVDGIAKKHGLKIKAVDLIGRRHACIDPVLADLDHDGFYQSCEKKRKQETCEFYMNARGFNKVQEARANHLFKKLLDDYGAAKTHQEVVKEAEAHGACPYEWMMKLAGASNVIIADYYHFMIPAIRDILFLKTKKQLERSVVIIDEAHNLAPRVREHLSSTVSSFVFRRADKEMKLLKAHRMDLEKRFDKWAKERLSQDKEKLVSGLGFDNFLSEMDVPAHELPHFFEELGLEFVEQTNRKSACLKLAKFIMGWKGDENGVVRLLRKKGDWFTLSKRFLDPSPGTSVLNECHSAILMSGTLLPLEMHRDILGLDEGRTTMKKYPSPFCEHNSAHIIVEGHSTKFSKRNPENYRMMADKIDAIIGNTPGGTAVFFPSYIVQNSVIPFMKSKNLLVQKENSGPKDIAQLIRRFGEGGVLCGPQGGSLSVDYEEPLIIKKGNEIFIEKIGAFVNRMMEKNKILEIEGIQTSGLADRYEVSAFDPKTFKISFKPISKVIRHKINEQLFELTLQTGRKIKATGSHSVFSLQNGKIQSPKVSELKEGNYLLIPKILPTGKNQIKIELLEELLKLPNPVLSNIYVRGIGKNLNLSKLKKAGHPVHWTYRDTLPIKLLKEEIWNEKPKVDEIHIRWGHKIKAEIEVKKELFRLLGYYAAEGHHVRGRHSAIGLTFGSHEEHLVKDATRCIGSVFGIKPSTRYGNHSIQIIFGGKIAKLIIVDILQAGLDAESKRIPPLVLSASNEMKLEFLKGYFAGDGTASKHCEISFKTISKMLANDLMYLFLQLGIFAGCTEIKAQETNRKAYQIYVTNSRQLNTLLPIFDEKIKGILRKHIEISNKNIKRRTMLPDSIPVAESGLHNLFIEGDSNQAERFVRVKNRIFQKTMRKDLYAETLEYIIKERRKEIDKNKIKEIIKIIKSDFAFARIKKIRKIKSSSDYVYDVSVKGFENFVGGFGGVILHNTEGVDYCNEEIKTAVVVGIALEEMSLEVEALIDFYDEKFGKGWQYGYMWPAVVKAMQAAGRGIRKESDRCAIVYMDERFSWKNYRSVFDPGTRFIMTSEPEKYVKEFWKGD